METETNPETHQPNDSSVSPSPTPKITVTHDDQPQGLHRNWPHAPPHRFSPGNTYIVTCGTYLKHHLLHTPRHLSLVRNELFDHALQFGWRLEAWAVLINHYHIVAHSTNGRENFDQMLQSLHSKTAIELNRLDNTPGRKVWWNYRDTCLDNMKSYLARLHYVHRNPEKHGVVPRAELYPWCSMSWFMQEAPSGLRRSFWAFKIDKVNEHEEF
jgi:putative transposase